MKFDVGALSHYVSLLAQADQQIDRNSVYALRRAVEQLRRYAQSIAHRRSGAMADTMHQLGPFGLGNGILESHIASGAFYAIYEIQRGGEHDWAGRTLDEQAAILDQLAAELAAIVTTAIGIK